MARGLAAKARDDPARPLLPIGMELAPGRIHEQAPEQVAPPVGHRRRVAEHHRVRPVPGQEIEPPAGQAARTVAQALHQQLDCRIDYLLRRPDRRDLLASAEQHQMSVLRWGQLQGTRDRLEDRRGRADVAALLEPRVPGRADPGELGDLLAPEPGSAPAATCRKADILRAERLAAVAKEVGELSTARGTVVLGPGS